MALIPYALTRPFLFGLDPEQAHELTLDALARLQNTPLQCLWAQPRVADPVTLAGLRWEARHAKLPYRGQLADAVLRHRLAPRDPLGTAPDDASRPIPLPPEAG